MELKEIIGIQKQFDTKHKIHFNWAEEISNDNLQGLQFLLLSLSGEVGELANCVKKIIRGDKEYESSRAEIVDELTDIFIYVIKMAYQMNIDLEKSFFEKLEINKSRFKPFENNE